MRQVVPSGRFKRDLRRIAKRGLEIDALDAIVSFLQHGAPLPENAFPHKLSGEYRGKWECHIAPDWLLIYQITDEEVLLVRTGTHSDLFE